MLAPCVAYSSVFSDAERRSIVLNVRIRAGGTALIARQVRVHIVNSTIGGTQASYEASQGAEIYIARSTLTGVGRRLDTATMNDLGGNDYQLR